MNYLQEQIKEIAKKDQKEIINFINSNRLSIKDLSLVIETIGEELNDEEVILPLFLKYLRHVHLMIRESTIYSLSEFYNGKHLPTQIIDRLTILSKNDPSSTIRELAIEALEKHQ